MSIFYVRIITIFHIFICRKVLLIMKIKAFTDSETISGIGLVLKNIESKSPCAYVFFSLIFNYGIKQNDLLNSRITDVFCQKLSVKYPDIDLSECDLINSVPSADRDKTFKELLPNRNNLFVLLNKSAREYGISVPLNVSLLHKTWAYIQLSKGISVSTVMAHFSYRNGVYRFLTEFLGLSFSDCADSAILREQYVKACLAELSRLDYRHFSEEKQLEFLSLLERILSLFGFLK